MRDETVLNKLNHFEISVRKLVEAYLNLKSKYQEAQNEIHTLKTSLQEKEELLSQFQNQDKISNFVSSLAENNPEMAELKLKIDDIIQEIDKCIAQLSEQ
ncbi:MAG: hypothetical protein RLZZ175_2046 [Bacteroidota bacterium]|jgi:chromosome segregation ATPase